MRPTMRAYSHQGHGPRADQTGRIHISDFCFLRTISLAKRSRSIHLGHSRRSDRLPVTSGFPPEADINRPARLVRFVPISEVIKGYSITSSARASSAGDTAMPIDLAALRLI